MPKFTDFTSTAYFSEFSSNFWRLLFDPRIFHVFCFPSTLNKARLALCANRYPCLRHLLFPINPIQSAICANRFPSLIFVAFCFLQFNQRSSSTAFLCFFRIIFPNDAASNPIFRFSAVFGLPASYSSPIFRFSAGFPSSSFICSPRIMCSFSSVFSFAS